MTWLVCPTTAKDANTHSHVRDCEWACMSSVSVVHPADSSAVWYADDGGSFSVQSGYTVQMITDAEAAKAEADATARAATAEAELASMVGFTIVGSTGTFAPEVNGSFERANELVNGKPAFTKVAAELPLCCWCSANHVWWVGPKAKQDANEEWGYAATRPFGSSHPAAKGVQWEVSEGGTRTVNHGQRWVDDYGSTLVEQPNAIVERVYGWWKPSWMCWSFLCVPETTKRAITTTLSVAVRLQWKDASRIEESANAKGAALPIEIWQLILGMLRTDQIGSHW